MDKTNKKVVNTLGGQNKIKSKGERGWERITKQSIKTIIIIVTKAIITMGLITEIKLGLLLPKNRKQSSLPNSNIYKFY